MSAAERLCEAEGQSPGEGAWPLSAPAQALVRARGVPRARGALIAILALGALLLGFAVGPVSIAPQAIIGSALAHLPALHLGARLSPIDEAILWQVRAPRVILGALVGAMLAAAGAAYQGVFRNPLADPYLLGVAAGAGLGATVAIAYAGASASGAALPLAAFAGALIAVAGAYALARAAARAPGGGALVLAGVAIAAFLTALQTFAQQQRSQTLHAVYAWILGGLAGAEWRSVVLVAPYIALSCAVIIAHRRMLDVLALGDEEAGALGLNVPRVRLVLIIAATAGTAAAVSVSGLIGFVGIIVPHAIRRLVSGSYRAIVPLSLVAGGGFLVAADVIARSLLAPAEVPIGVVTAVFGAPFFALVLLRTAHVEL
ncbi:MAG TPA: iron ABC transporter permease [Solirubrobacteraceae bacterium]|nr:iron ABC transporter permease [Solirubrobacteraceae bacterium]